MGVTRSRGSYLSMAPRDQIDYLRVHNTGRHSLLDRLMLLYVMMMDMIGTE